MTIKAFLFDLDGTLLDTALDFVAIINSMRQQRGMAPADPEAIRRQASSGARAMLCSGLGLSANSDSLDQATEEFLRRYRTHCARLTSPFPGIVELLELIEREQLHWGVATNKPRHFSELILQQLGLMPRLATLVCPEQVQQAKPAPDMLLLACRQIDIDPAEAIYIGDDLRDIQAARQAGMRSIAVGYGYHPASEQPERWGADYYVADSSELVSLAKSLLSLQE